MRESIGSTFLYNMIFVFIIVVFGLISATMSYYKGFKVNTRILSSINKFAGYNDKSAKEIENYLSGIGYTVDPGSQGECAKEKNSGHLVKTSGTSYLYCVYYYYDDTGVNEKDGKKAKLNGNGEPIYYSYGVTSYIYVDLPIVGKFKIPVYTKGERIYNFSDGQVQKGG